MAKTHDEFVIELKSKNPNIVVLGNYHKAIEPIEVQCKKCGNIWSPRAYYLSQGRGCPKCGTLRGISNNKGKTHKKTTDEFIEQMSMVDENIVICSNYENTHTNILCRCKTCGNEWSAKPYSLLQGHGCPRCAKSGTSFMEQFIKRSFECALGEDAVISRDRSTIGMELDILIPSKKIAIEPGNWLLHENSYKRDCEKRKRCRELGMALKKSFMFVLTFTASSIACRIRLYLPLSRFKMRLVSAAPVMPVEPEISLKGSEVSFIFRKWWTKIMAILFFVLFNISSSLNTNMLFGGTGKCLGKQKEPYKRPTRQTLPERESNSC